MPSYCHLYCCHPEMRLVIWNFSVQTEIDFACWSQKIIEFCYDRINSISKYKSENLPLCMSFKRPQGAQCRILVHSIISFQSITSFDLRITDRWVSPTQWSDVSLFHNDAANISERLLCRCVFNIARFEFTLLRGNYVLSQNISVF